ncbi:MULTISPECIES: RinA family protein [unclassified Lactococcus]|uniref:RinA family protein n=1 Tax=unclassified Lactococcus TaxID=2643510 RepID=UPI0011C79A17|nr:MULTISPECIES: RinA family protein [unclassified Lactococcus]MQW23900.1 DUF722 domain-containing protein [Lactococcus sp. dk101]TXK37129.1 DUF722 domain-containing protein [Lactococcus sp. dk310]TXK47983.1 DUF722 domain-containing protein [Lactococcus sp. dk322]
MADKLDRIIGDYVNGRLEAKIKSIENRYLYKQKVDNLGIRTAYSGGSEAESNLLNKEALENDEEYLRLNEQLTILDFWFKPLIPSERRVIELKYSGYGGMYWYQVEQFLYEEGIDDIGIKKAKSIYYTFRSDILNQMQHCL